MTLTNSYSQAISYLDNDEKNTFIINECNRENPEKAIINIVIYDSSCILSIFYQILAGCHVQNTILTDSVFHLQRPCSYT